MATRVLLEQLASRPFDREVMHPGARLADLDGLHHVRVNDPLAEMRFAEEPLHRRPVVAQFFAQYLHGYLSVDRMPGPEYGGRATFANLTLERVARQGPPDQILAWHGREPNRGRGGKQASRASTNPCFLDKKCPRALYRAAQVTTCPAPWAGSSHPVGGSSNGQREGEVVQ